MAVNLIDFEAPTPPAFGQLPPEKTLESLLLLGGGIPASQTDQTKNAGDPFDMRKYGGRREARVKRQREST